MASHVTVIGGMLAPFLAALGWFLSLTGTVKTARTSREKALRMKAAILFLCILATQLAGFLLFLGEPAFLVIFFAGLIACVTVHVTASILTKRLRKRYIGRIPKRGLRISS
jgi:hypothetical protein